MAKRLSKFNQEQRDRALERARQVAAMRKAGQTFAEIARHLSITPQRAQQIYAKL